MTSPRLRRALVLAVVGVPLGLAAWLGWHAWQLDGDLGAAVEDAADLERALRVGDPAAASAASESLQEHTRSAAALTEGRTWSALERLPAVGDDAEGLALVSRVLADLAEQGVAPLVADLPDLDALVPVQGRVDVAALESMQAPVAEAGVAFADADDRLSARDASGFAGPLRDRYAELADRVGRAADALDAADRALRVLPTMLGRDGPRSYLLVFQNNAEVRATGGLPGALGVVTADDGRLRLGRQASAADLGEAERPVLPLTDAESRLYGPQLGTYLLDAGFTPSVPRAAALMRAHWRQATGERVDGVLMVDPVAVSYVLAATGSVDVGEATLTSQNVVESVLHQVYLLVDDTDAQDELFRLVARTVFDELVGGGADPQRLLTALARGAGEHRLLVHSFDAAEQAVLAGSAVAGEHTDADATGPQLGVYLNDNTGAKMSWFLRTEVTAGATSCDGDRQTVEGTATLRSQAPDDAAVALPAYVTGGGRYGVDPGYQLLALRIYGPVGGSFEEVTLDGETLDDVAVVDHDGRPVATVYPYLGPQQAEEVGWRVTSGPGQDGPVTVAVTPGVEAGDAWVRAPSAC